MIQSGFRARDLIGYLTFDVVARQATLVVCGRNGRPLREVPLIPVGALTRLLLRLGARLGRYPVSCRAIALDDGDGRTFAVWMTGARRILVSDESGERWLRSVDETIATVQRAALVADPEIRTVVRHFGFGDVSRN
jgi:hypothetical protein